MQIIPAIDLKDHHVVRLKQGRMGEATVYSKSILEIAEKWINQGATRLHVVDLNGAFEGQAVHFDDVAQIAQRFPQIQIEVGGGIRDRETIQKYFDSGVHYCILGTTAVKNPQLVMDACKDFPHKIILGLDAKGGFVATDGWDEGSKLSSLDVARRFDGCDLESIIYTDISKDGMLSGMNFEMIEEMKACGFPIIASGGVSSLEDIKRLVQIGGLHGVIVGKALYEDRFSLKDAIQQS